MNKNVYSVTQTNQYIKRMITQDFLLSAISVKGEVSNCKYHSSGHIYFTLKDEKGAISAIMFAGNRRGLAFTMQDGDQVVVSGSVDVYERDGKYQLYAKEIKKEGAGDLYLRYEALKKELAEMGMFAPEYKKAIPCYAMRIGVVTAPTGAAVRDICNIANRRNPYAQLILYPAQVQGQGAADSIIKGIQTLDAMNMDVIIIGRGGGSIEDLWAFNEEPVVRAVFECNTPIISAVGHETDTTLSDYAADMRAPTPSAAAELAVFDVNTVLLDLEDAKRRMNVLLLHRITYTREKLGRLYAAINTYSPQNQLTEKKNQLKFWDETFVHLLQEKVLAANHRFEKITVRLDAASPLKHLQKGYGYVEKPGCGALTDVETISLGDEISVHIRNAKLDCEIIHIEKVNRDYVR